MVKDHRSSENKSGYMLGHPVEAPVLATRLMRPKKVAVKIRCGRAISRKGSNARGQSHPSFDQELTFDPRQGTKEKRTRKSSRPIRESSETARQTASTPGG